MAKGWHVPGLKTAQLMVSYAMVQLKGNLTHVDIAHAIYWLKVHGFINPYWHVWEGKPVKINF